MKINRLSDETSYVCLYLTQRTKFMAIRKESKLKYSQN